jgi:hypothetical protein
MEPTLQSPSSIFINRWDRHFNLYLIPHRLDFIKMVKDPVAFGDQMDHPIVAVFPVISERIQHLGHNIPIMIGSRKRPGYYCITFSIGVQAETLQMLGQLPVFI